MTGKSRQANLCGIAAFTLTTALGVRAEAQSFEPYMKTRSRVIGVQSSPLQTYPNLLKQHFPSGVGTRESGVVLELLRAKKAQQMLGPVSIVPGYGPVRGTAPPRVPIGSEQSLESDAFPLAVHRHLPRSRSSAMSDFTFTARPMNSHGQVGVDALDVRIAGVDESGRAVRLTGSMQASLWALEDRHDRKFSIRDPNVMTLPSKAKIRRLAVWMRPIGRDNESVTLALPPSRPDTDLHWSTDAILHVRLAVPGVGVFEKRQTVKIGTELPAMDLHALRHARRRLGR